MNAFSPNVSNLIKIYPNEIPFKIEILNGKEKPYFYKDGEGFNSKGVYVRIGSTKRIASFEEIQRMIFYTKAHEFERQTSEIQDLTFNYIKDVFEKKDIVFDEYGLLLKNSDGKYNKAALLLSDQNPTISKFAVFQGTDVSIFLDKKEFKGSIVKQLDEILYFSSLSNRKKVIITGKARREEYLDIPEKALRETIVNAYCHRDFTLSGDIKIEFYDDKVKIFSPGSLPDGLTLENIKMGMVAKRNNIIVNALDKAEYIENYASGIRRIFDEYKDFNKQPDFYISDNGVIVTLYNRNYGINVDKKNVTKNVTQKITKTQRKEKILLEMKKNEDISIEELSKIFNLSIRTIKRDILELKNNDKLEYIGSSKLGKWIVK